MNERIAKLYNQAIIIEDGGDYVCGELDPEKFAELIVEECVKLQYKNVVVGGVSDYNRGRRELAEEILKHFGVELRTVD